MSTAVSACVADLRKCKLFPGSMIDVAIRGDWLSESLLRKRGSMAHAASQLDDATPDERTWADVFRRHGYA